MTANTAHRLMTSRVTTFLATLTAGILISVPAVGAPSSADQYIPSAKPDRSGSRDAADPALGLPQASGVPGGADANGNVGTQPATEETQGDSTAPGSDYPITPLLAIILAVVGGGLLLRVIVPALARRGG